MNGFARAALAVSLLAVLVGCMGSPQVEQPAGPFSIAIFATTDTRGELEPCG